MTGLKRFFVQLVFAIVFASITYGSALAALDIEISEPQLEITSGFSGDTLTLFGTAKPAGDIIIVLSGPKRDTMITRKQDVAGLWIGSDSLVFRDVPGYYNIASSRPVTQIADADTLAAYRLGLDGLSFVPDDNDDPVQTARFEEALIQNKQLRNLYSLTPDAVTYINDSLFRTQVRLPANVPLGQYSLDAYLFRDGRLVDRETKPFTVAQTGLTARIHDFAGQKPFLYALTVIFAALISSVLANVFLRKD